ncbi:MAG: stage III sporulation protein AB [Oscillospiraceae bacterium]|nr:stage III sporulation protein AB [Oscillospiraceae bacterium]
MIKILGIIFITIAFIGVGFLLCERYKKRMVELSCYLDFLNKIETEMRYTNAEIGRIIEFVISNDDKSNFALNMRENHTSKNIIEKWQEFSVLGKNKSILTENDKQLFLNFSEFIGKTDLEGQLKSFTILKEKVRANLSHATDDYKNKGNMYRQLFMFGGIGLSIIFI